MKKFILLLFALLTVVLVSAQSRSIRGTVVSAADGEPLVGATVIPVGGGSGTATDLDGKFHLTVSNKVSQLTVSYIGMKPVTVPVQDNMTIRLEVSDTRLDEVVVTGYGSGKKLGSIVGSLAVVGEDVFADSPASNFVDALQGQVPGLSIFSNTGEPSSVPANIRIRGVNSLDASNTPLFILDGAPVSSSVFTTLNMNDIENVTVLKDAVSTAIYGSRAANGVIVITTKKGKFGQEAQVTVRANVGWSAPVKNKIKMMNSQQYIQFRDMVNMPVSDEIRNLVNTYGISTDWQDEMIKDNAMTYSLEAAVSGGSENLSYFISLNHYDQDGLIASSGMRREALRASLDAKVNDWFRIGFQSNLGFRSYETNSAASYAGTFYTNNPIVQSYMMLPYDSPRYYTIEDGKIVYGEKAVWYKYSNDADANFVTKLNHGKRSSVTANIMIYEQINPIKGLTLRAQQAVDAYDYRNSSIWHSIDDFVTPMGDKTNFGQYTKRQRGESFERYYSFTYTNTAEYKFNINDLHNISVLAGQESIISKSNQFNVSTTGQPNSSQMLLVNGNSVTMNNVGQEISETAINSWFFNASYDFDNRYFIDASYRRDGSSKFAPDHRWANFYSAGVMWNVIGESFMKPYTWLDDLKLRVNYGTTGNSGIPNYAYFGTVGSGNIYNGGNSLTIGNAPNYDLTWETVKSFDVGVSFSFLNKLYGSADFYVKNTEDMLMEIPYSFTTGYDSGNGNIGSMRNTGVDIELGAHIIRTRDWYWGIRANFNYNKNEITELFNGKEFYSMPDYGLYYEIGKDANQLRTVMYAGVDPRDGKQMWYTKDGNLTKEFNRERDAVSTGKSFIAPWTGGFGTDLRWKNIALRADFAWAAEKYIFNWAHQMVSAAYRAAETNQCVDMLNVWTKPGDITDIPNATETPQGDSRYLENSSFLRMKNLTLQYSLDKKIVNKLGMKGVILHFTGRNLLTFTADGYTGTDPEYENNGVRFAYPNTRQYEFGLEVSF